MEIESFSFQFTWSDLKPIQPEWNELALHENCIMSAYQIKELWPFHSSENDEAAKILLIDRGRQCLHPDRGQVSVWMHKRTTDPFSAYCQSYLNFTERSILIMHSFRPTEVVASACSNRRNVARKPEHKAKIYSFECSIFFLCNCLSRGAFGRAYLHLSAANGTVKATANIMSAFEWLQLCADMSHRNKRN